MPHVLKLAAKSTPFWIGAAVVVGTGLLQTANHYRESVPIVSRLEWMSYDWRVRLATNFPAPVATNLGFVAIDDWSGDAVLRGALPYQFGLFWPRQVYGFLLRELTTQGAKAVAFDVLFAERRPDHQAVKKSDGTELSSDEYFAEKLRQAGNVILASENSLPPDELFHTNAWAVGDVTAKPDNDGVLRHVKAFDDVYLWHPLIKNYSRYLQWKLPPQGFRSGLITVTNNNNGEQHTISVDAEQRFNPARLYEEVMKEPPPQEVPTSARAFTVFRAWHLGILLAARELGLDLSRAVVEPERSRIVLHGANGLKRTIPIDAQHRLLTDWNMTPKHSALTTHAMVDLLLQDVARNRGEPVDPTNRWQDKLVVVGSTATGGNLSDLGATPLDKHANLVAHNWNIANSVIMDRFVRPTPLWADWLAIVAVGALAGVFTWRSRAEAGAAAVLALVALYVTVAAWLYVQWRLWLPIALPVLGGHLMTHVSLLAYKVTLERAERQRVKGIFSKIVSPEVVNELLGAEKLSLGGVRRNLTVAFADIRGFTEFTDRAQADTELYLRAKGLSGELAEQHAEQQARQLFETVNRYVSVIADSVKTHRGTLDKYIGDCVMAFWGAPVVITQHARGCVRAMVEAQQAIHRLNQERANENARRAAENVHRASRGEDALPALPLLSLGIGINTGLMNVGLMGSEKEHMFNYTVFGREVNVASRLESVAGRGRVIITEATHAELRRDDPALAATCLELAPVTVKGIHDAVRIYEVPWQNEAATGGQTERAHADPR